PMTTPAHASILTGLYPKSHGIRDNRNFRLKGVTTLPELFKEKSFKTVAVVSGAPLLKKFGLNKGFDIYDDNSLPENDELQKLIKGSLKTASQTSRIALNHIEGIKDKLFLWVHFYDPHYPYNPPKDFQKMYPKDFYAGEIAYVDSVLGDFFESLLKIKNKRWIIIIVGDHGEDLGEHGEDTHGILLYNTVRKVPFIYWDSQKKTKKIGEGSKSLIDIFPTVQEIFDLRKTTCEGKSIFQDSKDRFLFSETFFPLCFSANPGFSAKKEKLVLIQHGTSFEMYEDSFAETKIDFLKGKSFFKIAKKEIDSYFNKNESISATNTLTEEESKILSSLGYIGTSSVNLEKITQCDLKELARDFSSYTQKGWEYAQLGDSNVLLREYNRLLKKYPFSPLLHCDKSDILIKLKKYEEAFAECKICVMLDPHNSKGYFKLANLSTMKGKFKEAENYYQNSIKYDENFSVAYLNLGMLYFEKLKNEKAALINLKKFLELDPNHPEAKTAKQVIKELESDNFQQK
ncbi:MAG: sulfatase-like hydrolase/transferase, partial [Acidobacteria bacterium]|nr:sulfatase-like hydrolase/transferase [Acidobacteriota bacterium]